MYKNKFIMKKLITFVSCEDIFVLYNKIYTKINKRILYLKIQQLIQSTLKSRIFLKLVIQIHV